MIHHRQRLPLGLEAGDHLLGVHARLDDLQRDPAADRLGLLGDIDDAHSPFADLLQQLVGADEGAGLLRWRSGRWWRRLGCREKSRPARADLQQLVDLLLRLEFSPHRTPGLGKQPSPRRTFLCQRFEEYRFFVDRWHDVRARRPSNAMRRLAHATSKKSQENFGMRFGQLRLAVRRASSR